VAERRVWAVGRDRQSAESQLAGPDRIVTDDLRTVVADDHLGLGGGHFDLLADQALRHQVACRPETNAAAPIDGALHTGAQRRPQRW
jgi:hypothetical protein